MLLASLLSIPNPQHYTIQGVDDDFRLQAPRSFDPLVPDTRYALVDLFRPRSFGEEEIYLSVNDGEVYGFSVTIDPGAPAGAVDILSLNGTQITSLSWMPVSGDSLGASGQHSFIGMAPYVRLRLSGMGAIMFLDYDSTTALANGNHVDVNMRESHLAFLIGPNHLWNLGLNDRAVIEVTGQGPLKLRAWDHLFHEIGYAESSDTVRLPLRVGTSGYARILLEVGQLQTVGITITVASYPAPGQPLWALLFLVGLAGTIAFVAVLIREARQRWRRPDGRRPSPARHPAGKNSPGNDH